MHRLNLLYAAYRLDILSNNRRRRQNISIDINAISDSEFISHFRLNKRIFQELCDDLKVLTSLKGTNQHPVELKVLTALSFFATGSYQKIVGVTQHIVQKTVSRFINEVVEAISSEAFTRKWINFPQSIHARSLVKTQFHSKFHLPGVIGCIDCTHVAIIRPVREEPQFFNRKGYHSLNVQMVCDANLKILNVNPKFGGASHDSFIWQTSNLENYMRQLHENGEMAWLLGDSGYPQRPWLMTPIVNAPQGNREALYTKRHVSARNCIERCFGLLKSRWRCLLRHRTLHYSPEKAAKIVIACSVLHNIAIDSGLPSPPEVEAFEVGIDQSLIEESSTELMQGRAMLRQLVMRM